MSIRREALILYPAPAKEPLIGRWLSYLEDGRKRTKEVIEGLSVEALDWQGASFQNSIGTLLYHIAAIEADWLYAEILEQPDAEILTTWFPFGVRDKDWNLSTVKGWEVGQYLELLDKVRREVVQTLGTMTLEEFQRVRKLEPYDVTPEWVCSHLLQHEAAHRGQILLLREHQKKSSL